MSGGLKREEDWIEAHTHRPLLVVVDWPEAVCFKAAAIGGTKKRWPEEEEEEEFFACLLRCDFFLGGGGVSPITKISNFCLEIFSGESLHEMGLI